MRHFGHVPSRPRLARREKVAVEGMPARQVPSVGRMVDELIMVKTRVVDRTTEYCKSRPHLRGQRISY